MKDSKQKTSSTDVWDGDYKYKDISGAKYRIICDVPGYKLSKPIEVALFEEIDRGLKIGYRTIHVLPSPIGNAQGTGIVGTGKTEDEACKKLSDMLITRYEHLCKKVLELSPFLPYDLPCELKIEKLYLDAILFGKVGRFSSKIFP